MPFTIPNATVAIASGLASVAHIGPGAVKFALAVATGVDQWIHGVPILTTDTGTVGGGAASIALTVPPPALQAGLAVGFAAQELIGPMSPLTIVGLATGLSQAFAQALVISTHPGVVGACVIQFGTSSAVPAMLQGFATHDMKTEGSIKTARAIGIGLDHTFSTFSMPCPIPGAPGPSPAAGRGFGFVL